MAKRKSPKNKNADGAEALMRELFERMEKQPTAADLNDNVIIPFAAALEEVCASRGYMLNIFGETSNIVYTGSEQDAEAIYRLVEEYLAARGGDG